MRMWVEAKGCCENGANCGYCHLPHGERVWRLRIEWMILNWRYWGQGTGGDRGGHSGLPSMRFPRHQSWTSASGWYCSPFQRTSFWTEIGSESTERAKNSQKQSFEGLHILHSPGFPVSTWLLSIFRFQESKESCIKLFSLLQEMLQRAVRGRAEQKLGFRWGCSEKHGNNMVISNRYHGALTCHLCAVTISVLAFHEGVLAHRHVELSMLST